MWDSSRTLNALASLMFAAAAVLGVYALFFLVLHLPVFPYRELRVNGKLNHVTREQVQYVVRQELAGNFFTLDLVKAHKAFEKLPWVRNVEVRRKWPDRLEVILEEHVALARWGNVALVNTHGEQFQAATSAELPIFSGPPETSKEITQQYVQLVRMLGTIRLKPHQVNLSPRRAWQVRTADGLVIELGRENTEKRLERFVQAYSTTVGRARANIPYVDLRYANGFAAQVKGVKLTEAKKGG